jgi:hypothetical protein
LIPCVRQPNGEPAAYPETVDHLLTEDGPAPSTRLLSIAKQYRALRTLPPADVARSLQPLSVELLREIWPEMLAWLEQVGAALAHGYLEVVRS